ncbi:acyl-CoA N-acyltransferase [Clohesyomyces aquaticus]|uniref:Acyl-CoA N-acyltransferase n=1 Tax=Clohesyomyces aquaticus TaxID=1231657 RepID=A0A1Y2A2U1_9PLEO|nr:acyl-CoA N-acyltransferase [Clohesyomyces aquaticus]
MTIRPARFTDHGAMSTVCCAAFFDENLFGHIMHPHRKEYPDDPALYWHAFVRDSWFDWRTHVFVAVAADEKNGGKEKVVGVSVWERQGAGGKEMELSQFDPRNILSPLAKLINRVNAILYRNRAIDPSKANILHDGMPFSKHHWDGERGDNWYLSLLAVHPDWHGVGLGKELVEWGIQQADKENVHASVIASDGKEKFYLKCGFDEIVGNACSGEGNPMNGARGGDILFRYPKGSVEAHA